MSDEKKTSKEEKKKKEEDKEEKKAEEEKKIDWDNVSKNSLVAKTIGSLCMKDIFSDVKFIVGHSKTVIPAHRIILATRSEVFAAQLLGGFAEAREKCIEVPDVEPEIWKIMMQVIYQNKAKDLTPQNAMECLFVAKKYQIEALRLQCMEMMNDECTPETACYMLESAPKFVLEELSCFRFIEDNCEDCIKSRGFLELSPECVGAIVRSDKLAVKEAALFGALVEWAKHRAKKEKKSYTDLLKEFHAFVRYPLLAIEDIAALVGPTQLLTPQQQLSLFQYVVQKSTIPKEAQDRGLKPKIDKSIADMCFAERNPRAKVFRFVKDHDTNGILYWLGTKKGDSKTWKNPEDLKLVEARASNVYSGSPKQIVSRDYEGGYTNSNGPGHFIQVEFKDITVKPTHYAYSTRKSSYGDAMALRSWVLLGSNNGTTWDVLDRRQNDTKQPNTAQTTTTWAIDAAKVSEWNGSSGIKSSEETTIFQQASAFSSGKSKLSRTGNSLGFYSILRLVQTGYNAYSNYQLNYGNLEFYGLVRPKASGKPKAKSSSSADDDDE